MDNKFDTKIGNLPSFSRLKKSLLIYFEIDENSIFDVLKLIGIKLLNSLEKDGSFTIDH